jgi:hypothetical protein
MGDFSAAERREILYQDSPQISRRYEANKY